VDALVQLRVRRHRGHVVAFAWTDQAQKLPKRLVFYEWISERDVRMDPIRVAASATTTVYIPSFLEITQDAVGITFRNAGGPGDLPYAQIRLLGKYKENLSVIRYEGPPMR
jgi:hypothetical protein